MYKHINYLRFWCHKILPLVYDDSLSYYELLCKVVYKLNELIENQEIFLEKFDDNLEDTVAQILNEWLEDGTIQNYLNNLVIVNDYGAKGDGVTDDTSAIQRCIDENPNATIMFKQGVYVISDTITLWGASGGQYVVFGGATLKWNGVQSNNAVMVLIEKDYVPTVSSMCRIVGGNFDGNGRAGVAIVNHAFYTDIGFAKIFDFTKAGIINGTIDLANDKSTQAKIHNCHIFMSEYGEWSMEDTTGIIISCPDNHISEIVTNRLGTAYQLIVGGNTFTNCHSTVAYKNYETLTNQTYGGTHIKVTPKTSGDTQQNIFIGCYFNVGKYVVNAPDQPSSLVTSIYDSQYVFYHTEVLNFRAEAFLCSGYRSAINVDNFDVMIGGNYDFYGYVPSMGSMTIGGVPKKFEIIHSRRHPEADILSAQNLCTQSTESIMISHANSPMPSANTYYEIGAIFFPYIEESDMAPRFMSPAKIQIDSLTAHCEAIVTFNDNLEATISHFTVTSPFVTRKFFIAKNYKVKTFFGRNYIYYPVYANWSANLSDRTTVLITGLSPFVQGFVRYGVTAENAVSNVGEVVEIFDHNGTLTNNVVSPREFLGLTFQSDNAGIRIDNTNDTIDVVPASATIQEGKNVRLGTSGSYRWHSANLSDHLTIGNTELDETELIALLNLLQ